MISKQAKECGCKKNCSCQKDELYERVKKRYHLGNNWPYWFIPSKLIEKERKLWLEEIKKSCYETQTTNRTTKPISQRKTRGFGDGG